MKPKTIALDFDGTCVAHAFPEIGEDIGAVPVLRRLVASGHKLILFTMRSNVKAPTSEDPHIVAEGGNYLSDALEWFYAHKIPLYGIQKHPTQHKWTHSPKAYAHLYIDDAALGIPLTSDQDISPRPFVNWRRVEQMLEALGYFKD